MAALIAANSARRAAIAPAAQRIISAAFSTSAKASTVYARSANTSSSFVTATSASTSTQRSFSTTAAAASWSSTPYEFLIVTVTGEHNNVALITLNRPKALNALCNALMNELNAALKGIDADASIGAIVLTGSEKAFAAGADIKEMMPHTWPQTFSIDMLAHWHNITTIKKPVIAAVNGYALGGGCELAMMCDIILAGDRAKFGQPEVTIGTIPGCGGTQRLTRAVGKSRAMELILTGDQFTAQDALTAGLVSRVVPAAELVAEAVKTAGKIASLSQPIIQLAKEAVNAAYESGLQQGVLFERRLFHASFGTADQKAGMAAFAAKAKPTWTNQ